MRPPYRALWSTCGSSWGVSPAGAGAGIAGAGGLSAAYCSAELQNSVRADLKTPPLAPKCRKSCKTSGPQGLQTPPLAPKCRKSCKTLLQAIFTNAYLQVRAFCLRADRLLIFRFATFPTFSPSRPTDCRRGRAFSTAPHSQMPTDRALRAASDSQMSPGRAYSATLDGQMSLERENVDANYFHLHKPAGQRVLKNLGSPSALTHSRSNDIRGRQPSRIPDLTTFLSPGDKRSASRPNIPPAGAAV